MDFQHSTPQNNDAFNRNTKPLPVAYLCALVLDVEGLWLQLQVVWSLASLEKDWGDQRSNRVIL